MSLRLLALLAIATSAAAQPLPTRPILLKTHQQTFNLRGEFALSEGKIWIRQQPGGEWKLLGGTGLPFGKNVVKQPTAFTELAADGNCLVAVTADRHLYDVTIHDLAATQLTWEDGFGYPYRIAKKPVFIPAEARTWTFSLIDQEGALYTSDIDGNAHVTVGVFTVWAVDKDGRSLRYDDPWLPPNEFEFRVGTPERSAFAVHSISSSGSTVFVMDRTGRMFTRHVDYDTVGGNPGIRYSYKREDRHYKTGDFGAQLRAALPMFFDVRSLPPEDWREQPRPPGRYTDAITILQNGRGNAARELRIEGLDGEGHVGLWKKAVFDEAWTFQRTDEPLIGKELDPKTPPESGGSPDECFGGTALFGGMPANARATTIPSTQTQPAYAPPGGFVTEAQLQGFNLNYDPMKVRLVGKHGEELAFTINVRPGTNPIRKGENVKLLGEFEPAPETARSPELNRVALSLPGVRPQTDAYIWISDKVVKIETDPFGQPNGERVEFRFLRPEKASLCVEEVAPGG